MLKKVMILAIVLSVVTMITASCDRGAFNDQKANSTASSSYEESGKVVDNTINPIEATDNNTKLGSNAGETKPDEETHTNDTNELEPFCAPPNYKIYSRNQILNYKNSKDKENETVLNRITDEGLFIPKEIDGFETLYIELIERARYIEESDVSIEEKNDRYKDSYYSAYLRSKGCTHDAEYYAIDHEECDLITFVFRNNYEKYNTFGIYIGRGREGVVINEVNSKARDIYYRVYDDPINDKNSKVNMEWMEGSLYVRVSCSKEVLEKVGFDNLEIEKVKLK